MKIVVCIKQVPDTREIRIDPETNNIIRAGVPSIMNPHDLNAIEQALAIKDWVGGEVVAISMGPMQATAILQEALNMGADRAILLSDRAFAGSDTLATGYTLSTLAKELGADLVLCGSEAIDGCTGQVGPIAAENLDWPHFTYVHDIEVEDDCVRIRREVREGYEIYTCKFPFVACMLNGSNIPRKMYPTEKKPEVWTVENVNFDRNKLGSKGSPTKVSKIHVSGKNISGFVAVDGSLPVRKRIRMIVNGGIEPKVTPLIRKLSDEAADLILAEEALMNRLLS